MAREFNADVIVNGHDHDYERFAPMDADGNPDPAGIREFIVGTGGGELREFGEPQPNSEVRIKNEFGVIKFNLYPASYEWEFIPVDPSAQADSGSAECH